MTNGRRGFALVASLIAVVLLGALIVGTFVAASEEIRISTAVKSSAHALAVAESAAEGDVVGWASVEADSVPPGGRLNRSRMIDGFQVTTTLIRLHPSVFWLVTDAAEGTSPATDHRKVGVLLRRVSDSAGHGSLLRLEERAWAELF